MFSTSRVMFSSIKCLWANSIQKANLVVYPRLGLKTKYCTTFKEDKVQSLKLHTHYRHMATMIVIRHENNGFFIEMNKQIAGIKYNINDGVMEIKHTKVPKQLAGHGLGKLLAKVALEYAVQHKLALKISCSFVQHYINEFEPRYQQYIL